ncbi:hypothetical protein BJX96DRAFT_43698 [Aspergillus floccosus]
MDIFMSLPFIFPLVQFLFRIPGSSPRPIFTSILDVVRARRRRIRPPPFHLIRRGVVHRRRSGAHQERSLDLRPSSIRTAHRFPAALISPPILPHVFLCWVNPVHRLDVVAGSLTA